MKKKVKGTSAHLLTHEQWDAIAAAYANNDCTPRSAQMIAGVEVHEGCGIVSEGIKNGLSFSEFCQAYATEIAEVRDKKLIRDRERTKHRNRRPKKFPPTPDMFCMFGRSIDEMLTAAKRIGRGVCHAQIL